MYVCVNLHLCVVSIEPPCLWAEATAFKEQKTKDIFNKQKNVIKLRMFSLYREQGKSLLNSTLAKVR